MTHHIGKVLTAARTQAGSPSYSHIERALIRELGDDAPTQKTVIRYHNGEIKDPDIVLVAALAKYYGLKLSDFGEDIAERFEQARDLLMASSRWSALNEIHPAQQSLPGIGTHLIAA